MTQNAHVPAREPVSDILSEAARLGLEPQPGTLPCRAKLLHAAVDETLDGLRRVGEPLRGHVALDTTVVLHTTVKLCAKCAGCAGHARQRFAPTTAHRVGRIIPRCFALYGAPPSYGAGAFRGPAVFCGGGIRASSLKDRAIQVRDEGMRRPCGDGADYPALARCHDLAPRVSAGSSTPAEWQAVTEPTPSTEEQIAAPFLNVHAIPVAGC